MDREKAEITALRALAYLAGNEKNLDRMMRETGIDPRDLATTGDSGEILAGILDFLLGHEDMLIDFCEHEKMDALTPARARRLLPGAPMEDY
ncbi:MAG: hypothetical protein CMN55_12305 [Sneathiella sp.]|uniref:DUF3572 domain-containing protein n=1 Tax=Sneathiella sp. TaxID=1964365 RepID=UPI000C5767BF|nr:DUF3572 domain-containing protein [Sneathiella sp.]MAL79872.1 hypothetical protein [Sneathiella sp.]|tara:strand:- start:113 stop:388 length:276 start_codon:yes stop_codon:yes gene_type:complete